MNILEFHLPGPYENPLTASGRGRTIAAFHLAQGNIDTLGSAEMRRDALSSLMSPRAVGYWLNEKGWLEKTRKIGRVQLLRLTAEGLSTCHASVNGGSNVPTSHAIVSAWRRDMLYGRPGFEKKTFAPLNEGGESP